MHVATQNATLPITQEAVLGQATLHPLEVTAGHRKSVKLRSRRPTSLVSSEASAEDKPLFMISKQSRKHERSLSPIGNRETAKKKRPSEPIFRSLDDPATENMSWDIINREIAEWQSSWQTGHPSGWSSTSKTTRRVAHSTWQEEFQAIPPWHLNPDYAYHPKQRYDEHRRAVTDSYLADSNNAENLARLIAIQLLSACFTLPPEQMVNYKSTAYHCFQTLGADELPDSRLISSLRMHAEARYSPSFGHQAPNTSPDSNRKGEYDGRSPSRRGRIYRALHLARGSTDECSGSGHSNMKSPGDLHRRPASPGWQWSEEGSDSSLDRELPSPIQRRADGYPRLPKDLDFRVWHTSPFGSRRVQRYRKDSPENPKNLVMPLGLPGRSLESVIHSEPHHIYIQPVKELVVKRWQTLRRRVGQSLSHGHHDPLSPALQVASATASPNTESGQTLNGSPVYSSDRKKRRRQARERGDIHSSSAESSPRYNTLTSTGSSGTVSPADLGSPSRNHQYLDALGVAAAIANVFAASETNVGLPTAETTSSPTQAPSDVPVPSTALTNCLDSRRESGHSATPSKASPRPLQLSPSKSVRRQGQRRQRKSMLSEMCTAEDLEEEMGIITALGSALASPREESGSDTAVGFPTQILNPQSQAGEKPGAPSQPEEIGFSSELDELLEFERSREEFPRPGIVRTSTSGTQVFNPSKYGIEVDGLPAGPTADNWDDKRRGSQTVERNFL